LREGKELVAKNSRQKSLKLKYGILFTHVHNGTPYTRHVTENETNRWAWLHLIWVLTSVFGLEPVRPECGCFFMAIMFSFFWTILALFFFKCRTNDVLFAKIVLHGFCFQLSFWFVLHCTCFCFSKALFFVFCGRGDAIDKTQRLIAKDFVTCSTGMCFEFLHETSNLHCKWRHRSWNFVVVMFESTSFWFLGLTAFTLARDCRHCFSSVLDFLPQQQTAYNRVHYIVVLQMQTLCRICIYTWFR